MRPVETQDLLWGEPYYEWDPYDFVNIWNGAFTITFCNTSMDQGGGQFQRALKWARAWREACYVTGKSGLPYIRYQWRTVPHHNTGLWRDVMMDPFLASADCHEMLQAGVSVGRSNGVVESSGFYIEMLERFPDTCLYPWGNGLDVAKDPRVFVCTNAILQPSAKLAQLAANHAMELARAIGAHGILVADKRQQLCPGQESGIPHLPPGSVVDERTGTFHDGPLIWPGWTHDDYQSNVRTFVEAVTTEGFACLFKQLDVDLVPLWEDEIEGVGKCRYRGYDEFDHPVVTPA